MRPFTAQLLHAGCALLTTLIAIGCSAGGGSNDASSGARSIDVDSTEIEDDGTRGPALLAKAKHDSSVSVGTTPLRRISRIEYNNSVRDLFGDTTQPAQGFTPEEKVQGFNANVYSPVSGVNNEQYQAAASSVASRAVAGFNACGLDDDDCVHDHIGDIARRAFRGTLGDEDRTALEQLYDDANSELDPAQALELAYSAILLSPRFLYVVEFGHPGSGAVAKLTPSEVAGRLALALWRSVPDAALLEAADQGDLDTAEAAMSMATNMLGEDKANAAFDDFVQQWLAIERLPSKTKNPELFPGFSAAMLGHFMTETTTLYRAVGRSAQGTLPNVLTAPVSFVNAELAEYYGASTPSGTGFREVSMPPERLGILTHGSVLAAHSHPTRPSIVFRGKLVRERLLCDPPPPPPESVDMTVPDAQMGQTNSDVFSLHSEAPQCAGCHVLMDPIGTAFGRYDAAGGFRQMENGADIDDSGEIVAPTSVPDADISGAVSGLVDLGEKLAQSEHVMQCFAVQALRYALGRSEELADADSLASVYERFQANDYLIRDAIVGVTGSEAFLHRNRVQACNR